jgi:energy-coupling factor transport system ATP-binding protein
VIDADHVTFRYPERLKPALKGVSFRVREGESLLVLGPSGSGKSTLTLCLDGLVPNLVAGEFDGTVTVAGLATSEHPVHALAQEVGLVFQDPEAHFCTLTVHDEVAFGLENALTAPEAIDAKVDEALAAVGLSGLRERRLETLSGGQKQRVALASILALGPKVLVLDEPSANLDPAGTREVLSCVRRLAATREHTLVVIEHKLDEIIEWIDSVLVLDAQGEVLFRGSPREAFYQASDLVEQAGIWRPQPVALTGRLRRAGWRVPGEPLTVEEVATALKKTPGLVDRLRSSSRRRLEAASTSRSAGREELLAVRELSFGYRTGDPVLVNVSFDLGQGEFVAIAGENGAGKSTLASLLSGVIRPPREAIYLRGVDLRDLKTQTLSAEIGHVFQNPEHQFVANTVRGEVAYSLSQSKRQALSLRQQDLIAATLQRFGLQKLADADPFSLSQGQKRRLSVAAMLVRGQSALVLDEPTFGQDRVQAIRLMEMLTELWREGHMIVVLAHDMELVANYARRLLVLRGGRLAFDGEPRTFFADDDLVAEMRLGRPILADLAKLLHRELYAEPGLLTCDDFVQWAGSPDGSAPASRTAAVLETGGAR